MNRRKFLTFAAALLPCSMVSKLLGQTVEIETQDYRHCAVETGNLSPLSDEGLVKEFDRLSEKVNWMLQSAKKTGLEVFDIKFSWRHIFTEAGPDKFIRVLMRGRKL